MRHRKIHHPDRFVHLAVAENIYLFIHRPPSINTSDVTPFLTLNVNDIYNRIHTIPIDYGTTLDDGIALAVKLAPQWLCRVYLQFCFPNLDDADWPESQVMQDAQSDVLAVAVRLVPIE